eukprot:5014358-Amphidinium_carterae.1
MKMNTCVYCLPVERKCTGTLIYILVPMRARSWEQMRSECVRHLCSEATPAPEHLLKEAVESTHFKWQYPNFRIAATFRCYSSVSVIVVAR